MAASSNKDKTSTEVKAENVPAPVPAAEPSEQVPEPQPAPTERTAPHLSAGVAAEIQTHGSAVDPFTGRTLTRDDLS